MTETRPGVFLKDYIAIPAVITLVVTLVRLAGELQGWSAELFNKAAGGGGALIGIVWLIPVFGALFALRLDAEGEGPVHLKGAFGFAFIAFMLNTGLGIGAMTLLSSPPAQLAVFGVLSVVTMLIARLGWPQLWRTLLAYGIAARLPVVIVMALSIFGGWDTHYAKPRPDWPPMGNLGLFLWTALLPQATIWIYLSVVGGMLFGAGAVAIRRLVSAPPRLQTIGR